MRDTGRRFVYILRSETDPNRHYVGVTSDVEGRLAWHNDAFAKRHFNVAAMETTRAK
jgi:predicted GIY-YIG superfamily endonuclease